MYAVTSYLIFFFFNDTATTEIYTLSLHDALPISHNNSAGCFALRPLKCSICCRRSEEHTSELQSQSNLVCRLLLEKKKNKQEIKYTSRSKRLDPCDGHFLGSDRLRITLADTR